MAEHLSSASPSATRIPTLLPVTAQPVKSLPTSAYKNPAALVSVQRPYHKSYGSQSSLPWFLSQRLFSATKGSTTSMTSWADQWDTGADPSPRRGSGGNGGDGKKHGGGDRVEKTKAAAATGLKKVKAGTTQGFQWIKDKYQQQKNGGKNSKQGSGGSEIAGY